MTSDQPPVGGSSAADLPPTPPPAGGYAPPPPAPGFAAPPVGGYQPPPPAPGFAAPPAADAVPPAPGAYPPAAPRGPGFGGFDSTALQNFDPKTVNPLDWGIIGAGVLMFLFSFFNFYVVKVKTAGISESGGGESGWNGALAPLAILLAIAASGVLAAFLIAKISLPFPVRLVALGGYAVASVFLLLAFFIHPGSGQGVSVPGLSVSVGHGFGYWISLLIALAATGLAYLRFTQTGGKLPTRR